MRTYFSKWLGALAALLAFGSAPAHAATLMYVLENGQTYTWTMDSRPAQAYAGVPVGTDTSFVPYDPDAFVITDAQGSFPGTTYGYVSDVWFWTAANGGGLTLSDPYPDANNPNDYFIGDGQQLFTGDVTDPTMLTGVFPILGPNRTPYTLTVTAVDGAVPEPATWAMMLIGFGAVGGAMRARKGMQGKLKLA